MRKRDQNSFSIGCYQGKIIEEEDMDRKRKGDRGGRDEVGAWRRKERAKLIEDEKKRSEQLLYRMLPR